MHFMILIYRETLTLVLPYNSLFLTYCIYVLRFKYQIATMWWPGTAELHSLIFLEAKSLKSRCCQGNILSGDWRVNSFLTSSVFWELPAQQPWLMATALQTLTPAPHHFSSVCLPQNFLCPLSYKNIWDSISASPECPRANCTLPFWNLIMYFSI